MNQEFMKTKTVAVYISIVAMLSVSAIAIPMQIAQAQTADTIIVRLVGAISQIGQAGLINVAVGNVVIPITVADVLSDNTVVIPVNVQANVPVTVCSVAVNVIGESGPQTCRVVNDAQLENDQIITLPVRAP